MTKIKTKRIDMRVPENIMEEIEKYQKEQGITNRTSAMLELIRIGLKNIK